MGINRGNTRIDGESLKRPALILVGVLIGIVALEVMARVAGSRPYVDPPSYGTSALFKPDTLLGYVPGPGHVELPLSNDSSQDTTWLSIRHNEEGNRATEPADNYLNESPRSEVWFVGGSDMYRIDLPDRETLPWRTYDQLKETPGSSVVVRNLSVPGYTDGQVYLLLMRAIGWGERPAIVVIPDRYESGSTRRDGRHKLASILGATDAEVPTIRKTDPLRVNYRSVRYRPIGLSRHSALVNAIDSRRRTSKSVQYDSEVLSATINLMLDHEIKVIVLNTTGQPLSGVASEASDDRLFDWQLDVKSDIGVLSERLSELITQMR